MTELPMGQVGAVLEDNLTNIYNCQYHTRYYLLPHHRGIMSPAHPQSAHGRLQIKAINETSQKFS